MPELITLPDGTQKYIKGGDNKKLTYFGIVIFALVVLIFLVYFMFLAPVKEEEVVVKQQETKVVQQPITENIDRPRAVVTPQATTERELKHLASSFTERYGTYSNQSGSENIRDLSIFMSSNLQSRSNNYITESISKNSNNDIYYGITTKTVVVETIQFNINSTSAEFLTKTQRKESFGTAGNARSFQQDATIKMIKERGVWKVDQINWDE